MMKCHFLSLSRHTLQAVALLTMLAGTVHAESHWYPSKYGADDTIGALNELNPEKTVRASGLVKLGKTYALGVETGPDSPAYSPRNYNVTVLQLDDGMGTPLGSNKATGNDDLMTFWMGIGSQIDGLGHMGENHVYYNGNSAKDFVTRHLASLSCPSTNYRPLRLAAYCWIWRSSWARTFCLKEPPLTAKK